jgi:large subunit ribosomal protein L4
MPQIDVINQQREKVGEITLEDKLVSAPVNGSLIHEAVVMQLASRRQGTAATKTRGLVSGGGKKPWRQKGTGRARAGSSRSPLWKGGGTTFGPLPRSYSYPFPRKKMRLALASALRSKIAGGGMVVIDQLDLPETKTKLFARLLEGLHLTGRVLIVTGEANEGLLQAAQNLRRVRVISIGELNLYDLLVADHLLVPKADVGRLAEVWL